MRYEAVIAELRSKLYAEPLYCGPNLYNSDSIKNLEQLIFKSRKYCKLQEAACNYGLSPAQEKQETKLEHSIAELAGFFGLKIEFSGDPRGFCVYAKIPDSRTFYNTWGGPETGYGLG